MRLPAALLTVALLAATSTACSEADWQSGRVWTTRTGAQADAAIAPDEARLALLTVEHLSDEFEVDAEQGDDEGSADWGCLTPDEGEDTPSDTEISFSAKREPGVPGVFNAITADAPSAEKASHAFDVLAGRFAECTHVHSREDDGTVWDFDVTTDTDGWAAGGDQQINVVATGTMSLSASPAGDAMQLPLSIRMSMVRVDRVATMVGFFDLAEAARVTRSAHRLLTQAATARLRAVLAGDEPPPARPLLEDYEFTDILDQFTSPTQAV